MTVRRPARGRPAAFAGKNKARSFTLTMTDAGYDAAEALAAARGMSRNDAIEAVLLEASTASAPTVARARCSHSWTVPDGRTVRCARRVGHEDSEDEWVRRHVWGAHYDSRPSEDGRT